MSKVLEVNFGVMGDVAGMGVRHCLIIHRPSDRS
jgi:hypothetical protein